MKLRDQRPTSRIAQAVSPTVKKERPAHHGQIMSTGTARKIAVICDMDETIYPGATAKDAGAWLLRHGYLGASIYLKIIWWMLLRKLHLLDHERAFAEAIAHLRGYQIDRLRKIMDQLYREELAIRISPAVRRLVKRWEQQGDLVFATESLAVIAAPMVADLGGQTVLGTELEIRHDIVTGRLGGPVLRDQAKAKAITAWAAAHNYDLSRSIGVGGRPEDVAMLELVGHPIMLNPDAPARALAVARGWEIIDTGD